MFACYSNQVCLSQVSVFHTSLFWSVNFRSAIFSCPRQRKGCWWNGWLKCVGVAFLQAKITCLTVSRQYWWQTDAQHHSSMEGREEVGLVLFWSAIWKKIAERNAESISRGRGALTEGCIRGWFADARKFFTQNKCEYILKDNTRQYNVDKTGLVRSKNWQSSGTTHQSCIHRLRRAQGTNFCTDYHTSRWQSDDFMYFVSIQTWST